MSRRQACTGETPEDFGGAVVIAGDVVVGSTKKSFSTSTRYVDYEIFLAYVLVWLVDRKILHPKAFDFVTNLGQR
jgi:hypothetical protein